MTYIVAGVFTIALLIALHLGQLFFLPLAVALLISFLFRPVVKWLGGRKIPHPLGALIIVSLITSLIAAGVYGLAEPARQWLEEAPGSLQQPQYRLAEWTEPVKNATEATEQVKKLGNFSTDDDSQSTVVLAKADLESQLFSAIQQGTIGLVTVLILLLFILGWGERLYRNFIAALPHLGEQRKAVLIAREIESAVSTYLATITLINFLLGAVVAAVLYLLKVPNPILWGVLTALLNYIPYLGPAITAVVLTFVSLLTFPTVGEVLLVPLVFIAITSLEGYILTPLAVGRRLSLNPLVIFLSLLFWYLLWGFMGVLLTVPILVCIKVALQKIDGARPYATILD